MKKFFFNFLLIGSIVISVVLTTGCEKGDKIGSNPLITVTPSDTVRASVGETIDFIIKVRQEVTGDVTDELWEVTGNAMLYSGGDYSDEFYNWARDASIVITSLDDTAHYVVPDYPIGTKISITFTSANLDTPNYQYARPTVVIE